MTSTLTPVSGLLTTTGCGRWYFSSESLHSTPSRRHRVSSEKELSYRQQAANFIQDMGQRLQVTQLCINTAIVYMQRFYMFHSFTRFHRNTMAAAALFLAAKVEEQPRKLEHVIKVAHICLHRNQPQLDTRSSQYAEQAQELVTNENILLQTLGFDVAIDHPHTHVVRCCQLVKASKELAQTSYFMATNSLHLTTMCLRHSPTIVACVCIHLACKWSNYQIPISSKGKEWFLYVDSNSSIELLNKLTDEFLTIFDKCPSRLKKKIMASTQATKEEEERRARSDISANQYQPDYSRRAEEIQKNVIKSVSGGGPLVHPSSSAHPNISHPPSLSHHSHHSNPSNSGKSSLSSKGHLQPSAASLPSNSSHLYHSSSSSSRNDKNHYGHHHSQSSSLRTSQTLTETDDVKKIHSAPSHRLPSSSSSTLTLNSTTANVRHSSKPPPCTSRPSTQYTSSKPENSSKVLPSSAVKSSNHHHYPPSLSSSQSLPHTPSSIQHSLTSLSSTMGSKEHESLRISSLNPRKSIFDIDDGSPSFFDSSLKVEREDRQLQRQGTDLETLLSPLRRSSSPVKKSSGGVLKSASSSSSSLFSHPPPPAPLLEELLEDTSLSRQSLGEDLLGDDSKQRHHKERKKSKKDKKDKKDKVHKAHKHHKHHHHKDRSKKDKGSEDQEENEEEEQQQQVNPRIKLKIKPIMPLDYTPKLAPVKISLSSESSSKKRGGGSEESKYKYGPPHKMARLLGSSNEVEALYFEEIGH